MNAKTTPEEARRLLAEQPDVPLVSVPGVGLMDRQALAFLAGGPPPPRQADLDRLVSATRLIVHRAAGPAGGDKPPHSVKLGFFDRRRLRRLFTIREPTEAVHCMCWGTELVEFHNGSEKLATLTVHHGQSVRWEKWGSDAEFADPRPLLEFLGLRESLRELQEAEDGRAEQANRLKAILANAPKWIPRDSQPDDALRRLIVGRPDARSAMAELLEWASAPRPASNPGEVSVIHALPEVALAGVSLPLLVQVAISDVALNKTALRFLAARETLSMMGVPMNSDEVPSDDRAALLALAQKHRYDSIVRQIGGSSI